MPSILDGSDEICDQWLGIDSSWPGTTVPRYEHKSTLQRLCREGWRGLDGQLLVKGLYDHLPTNWSGARCRSDENWRFKKQTNLGSDNRRPEVPLERTIALITDENWANQVPTASGVDDSGAHHLDLIHRRGIEFTFFELKVASNNPVSAAFQLVQYAMVYAFSCYHAAALGYDPGRLEILRAKRVELVVLAPHPFFPPECHDWLRGFEAALNSGLVNVARELQHIPSSFRFEVFPEWFVWKAEECRTESVRKDLLWALHQRHRLFTP